MEIKEGHNSFKVKVVFASTEKPTLTCIEGEPVLVKGSHMVDVYCSLGEAVNSMTLTLYGNLTLCSIYVSGGRNVALRQSTSQSGSSSPSHALGAVDGDTQTCAKIDASEGDNWLNVTFDAPKVVNRIVLHSLEVGNSQTIKLFNLLLFNAHGGIISTHDDIRDHRFRDQTVLNIFSPVHVSRVSVRAAPRLPNKEMTSELQLCEVEAYGDCVSGYWGLDCDRNCSGTVQLTAVQWTALKQPDLLSIISVLRSDLQPSCADSCYNDSCAGGLCTEGCYGYANPPNCTQKCPNGKYGRNCNSTCTNCMDEKCHFQTGACLTGCWGFIDFPSCTNGANCSAICSKNCYNLKCNSFTGICEAGCDGYMDPPQCQQACNQGHGYNCSCHEFCRECLESSNVCHECKLGFYFDDRHIECSEGVKPQFAMDETSHEAGGLLLIVPFFFIFVALGLTASGFYFYMKKSTSTWAQFLNQAYGANFLNQAHGVRSSKQANEAPRHEDQSQGANISNKTKGVRSARQVSEVHSLDQTQEVKVLTLTHEIRSDDQTQGGSHLSNVNSSINNSMQVYLE
ncbi:hypothetical protein Btru_017783 [Bulinus truncatus]|nr:hypothetical protein Btru_017783 [Bulinus truncatus]